MTAKLYKKNDRYQVMLYWYQDGTRKRKSVATGVSVENSNKRKGKAARAEAEEAMKGVLREWEEKVAENYKDILFSDYMLLWLDTAKHSIEATTYANYKQTIERLICPYFAKRKIKLHDLRPYHIQEFYRMKMEKDGVTGNTIHHYHANIHKALKHAYQTELAKDNPASKIILPKKERFVADFYTAEELCNLLVVVKGERIETPVMLAAWFGLRRGEALGLR